MADGQPASEHLNAGEVKKAEAKETPGYVVSDLTPSVRIYISNTTWPLMLYIIIVFV
jgi:hypothetical protein